MSEDCPCCDGELHGELDTKEMLFGWGDPFTYRTCMQCGTLAVLNPPADLSRYYPSNYYSYETSTSGRAGRLRRFAGALRADAYRDHPARWTSNLAVRFMGKPEWRYAIFFGAPRRNARILDVGAGSGSLLHLLWLDGFDHLTGVDPFLDPGTAAGVSRPGLRLLRANLSDLEPEFDLIMFNHSLEHVADPLEHLLQAGRILAPNGKILIRLPVADSTNAEKYGPNWFALDPPRHLFVPTRRGIHRIAERSGLVVTLESDDSGGFGAARSELYERGISSFGPDGSERSLEDHYSRRELEDFDDRARAANRAGRGDTTRFLLEKA